MGLWCAKSPYMFKQILHPSRTVLVAGLLFWFCSGKKIQGSSTSIHTAPWYRETIRKQSSNTYTGTENAHNIIFPQRCNQNRNQNQNQNRNENTKKNQNARGPIADCSRFIGCLTLVVNMSAGYMGIIAHAAVNVRSRRLAGGAAQSC